MRDNIGYTMVCLTNSSNLLDQKSGWSLKPERFSALNLDVVGL